MKTIGQYQGRQVIWFDYNECTDELPEKDWLCLAISNIHPDEIAFENFVRISISKNISEFKGHGKYGEKLHDLFDETMVKMEVDENHAEVDVMTTCHNDETLADVFWECFFATCLPETVDFDNIKIVCVDLDGINRIEELQSYLKEFELGWLPSYNIKHEVWQDVEGLTTLCLADERGNDCRNLLKPGSKLVHLFYAESHYVAMTIYYKYMDWGVYTAEFEVDKEPYENKKGS